MAKEIITTFVCGDFELHLMCAKPETFEGFAENACNLFFPEIEKYNSQKLEPVNLIPFGFLQNHTYFNTIYFPRALEWKFIFDDDRNKAKDFENDLAIIVWFIGKSFENNMDLEDDIEDIEEEEVNIAEEKSESESKFSQLKTWLNENYLFLPDEKTDWLSKQNLFFEICEEIFGNDLDKEILRKAEDLALIVWFIGKSFEKNTDLMVDFEEAENEENEPTERFLKIKTWLNKFYLFLPDGKIKWLSTQDLFFETCEQIFENDLDEEKLKKAKDLTIMFWFVRKSFDNTVNGSGNIEDDNDKLDEDIEMNLYDFQSNNEEEEFLKIKTWLNKDYLFLPDEKIKWLSEQDLFLEVCERIFNTEINEEGLEKTREIALKHSVKPKYSKEMLKSLKKSLEVYDNDEILDFVFKKNSLMHGLEILNSNGNYTLKIFFDLLNAENINDFLLEQDITQEFYEIISQFKVPKDLGEIIKVCPLLYEFIKEEEIKLKEYLVTEQSKNDFVKNLIKAVQKKLDSQRVIYEYLDIVNINNNIQDFLLELSKVSELDVVEFAIDEYKNYFADNALQTEIEEKSALAIYLNLYFNFDYVTARNVFDVNDENLNKLQNKLTKSSGEMDVDYVINFLTELPEKEQGGFIKKLGGNAQQKLKDLFKQYSDFSTRMKLASLLAKMKNTK